MLIECADGQRVAAFGKMQMEITQRLTAKHILLPLLGAERFLQGIDHRRRPIDADAIADITTIYGMGGDECCLKDIGASLFHRKTISKRSALRQ